jgi:pimeloyl-ACP methyl ester carboxylesterase
MKIPLVLLSGLLSNRRLWEHQIQHLGDISSIQVISASQNTPEGMIQAILKEVPPKFALAGHSMGGWLCLEIMRAAPERVIKLCLLNTTARSDSEEKRMKRESMIQQAKQGLFREVVKELVEKFVHNPDLKADVEKMFLNVGKESFIHQEQAMVRRNDVQSILPTIQCPVLTIHAMQDRVFSLEEHKEMVDQIRNAKLALVEDSGHMSPMEEPQAITSLLRYWLTYF